MLSRFKREIPHALRHSTLLQAGILFLLLVVMQPAGARQQPPSDLNILPPSPHSASLGKYGGIQPGLSSGTVRKDVPLLTFQSGKLSVPVSVSYASNGLKVDEIASRVGMSWNLNAGGVITRTVYGEVDEFSNRVTSIPSFAIPSAAYVDFLQQLAPTYTSAPEEPINYWDGEPDVFTFNFGGYSGQFILDANLVPQQLSNSGLKIVRNSATDFTITTPDGVRYLFGGTGATETVKKTTVGVECGRQYVITPTAFYLRQSIHPTGDVIQFTYTSLTYQYTQGVMANLSKRDQQMGPVRVCGDLRFIVVPNSNISCNIVYETSTQLLSKIESTAGGKIEFTYMNRTDVGDKLLQTIMAYKPGESTAYRSVVLSYLQGTTSNPKPYRPFLKGINIQDSQSAAVEKYGFSYYDLNQLPARLSYSQDYYGYPNGKSNSTFYPRPDLPSLRAALPEATADRKPNSSMIRAGMLSKITYPTGGTDSMTYESNTVWGELVTPAPETELYTEAFGLSPYGTGSTTSVPITSARKQELRIVSRCFFTNLYGTPDAYDLGQVEILRNNIVVLSQVVEINEIKDAIVSVETGDVFKIRVRAGTVPGVWCNVSLYYQGADIVTLTNKTSAGARLAKVITETAPGQIEDVRKYTYATLSDRSKSSGAGMREPVYYKHTMVYSPCILEAGCSSQIQMFHTMSSNAIYNLYLFGGVPVTYASVIEEQEGTGGVNGGTAYTFTVVQDEQGSILLGELIDCPFTNNQDRNSKEISRYTYRKNGTAEIPVEKVFTSYRTDSRVNTEVKAYVVRRKFTPDCIFEDDPPMPEELEPFDFMIYSHHLRWIYPDTVRTQTYNNDGSLYTETVQLSVYDNPLHAQVNRTILTKSDGNKEINYSIYADDYASGTIFINDMKTAHLTGLPIEQVRYKESGSTRTILSGQITTYKTGGKGLIDEIRQLETFAPVGQASYKFSNRATGTLPPAGSATAFSAYSGYQSRLQYNAFDASGNPLQYTVKGATSLNGPSTSLFWDYNNQYPVAEAKNAIPSQIAYSGFEGSNKGNWTYSGATGTDATAPTGKRVYNLSGGAVSKGGLTSSKRYVLLYWAKSASAASISGGTATLVRARSGWTQYKRVLTGVTSVTLSGSVAIDDLRLHPEEATMTTFTYEPLIGASSKTDEKGAVIYYEYDSFGRLETARDLQDNIIETYNYHYKNP